MMTKEGSTKIIKLMTPGAAIFCAREWLYTGKSYSENALFLYKSSLLCGVIQTNYLVHTSNNDHGRVYQYCKFRDPG